MTVGAGVFGVLTSYLSTRFLAPGHSKGLSEPEAKAVDLATKDDIAALQARLDTMCLFTANTGWIIWLHSPN